jgi:hydrogenase maturation protein HypF
MFRDILSIMEYTEVSPVEEELLLSWRRPIVILRNWISGGRMLAPSVSNGFPTTGAMLPYMPFHTLLFEKLQTPAIVLTSGNLAEEPILIDNSEAEKVLGPRTDAVLHYNRGIHNRTDDSVSMLVNDRSRLLRRSRGYVPNPIRLNLDAEGIFASGAELVNCFCLGKGKQAILSQHIGDLKNFETYDFYRETFERFSRTFRLEPSIVAHDLHPDYLSTQFAKDLGLPCIPVQHHHAHIASVMAEHRLDEKVIGVSFDGTGLGDDNHIWGSEFLICDLAGYERISHLDYIPMPGGDKATREPWRMAVSYLYACFGRDLLNLDLPFLRSLNVTDVEKVIVAIEKEINCPMTSGAGRLFDALAAMLDITKVSMFHAEAPMRLESAALMNMDKAYPYNPGSTIDIRPMIREIAGDIIRGGDPGEISGRFHYTVADIIVQTVSRIRKDSGIGTVAISGGTFQNRIVSRLVENRLMDHGFSIYIPEKVPANDGGIALGQLAVAAVRRDH